MQIMFVEDKVEIGDKVENEQHLSVTITPSHEEGKREKESEETCRIVRRNLNLKDFPRKRSS